jgi:hypothetical protein
VDVANQLLYAERHRLLPIVHLDPNEAELIYDSSLRHRVQPSLVSQFLFGHNRTALDAPLLRPAKDGGHEQLNVRLVPGKPLVVPGTKWNARLETNGSGIWGDYFEQLHDVAYLNQFESCTALPAMALSSAHVSAMALHDAPSLGPLERNGSDRSRSMIAAMRRRGHEVVARFFRFRPYLLRQADRVNPAAPTTGGANGTSCLAVHIRVGPKPGKHRSLVKADAYMPYLEAYVRGGGTRIYVATDSHRALQFVRSSFPEPVRSRMLSAGRYVVRSQYSSPHRDSLPTHLLESHHRVNAEALVDILALSKCEMLLHTCSSVAEAAVYLNEGLALHPERTINLEVPEHHRASPAEFETLARRLLAAGRR